MKTLPLQFLLSILFACHFNFIANAQTIKGRVTNTKGQSLALASVVLSKDSQFVQATTTRENGRFTLAADLQKGAAYQLHLSLVGYQSRQVSFVYPDTVRLRNIILKGDTSLLRAVSVTARRPLVTRRPDRYIVDVANSFLANGHSALEVLEKSPGIWVDGNGVIRLKGTQPVMVMINDVVQRMTGEQLADYLRSLRSEDISRIEVIQPPPAEFEAEGSGGIVHIIMKRERKSGFSSVVTAQYRQQGSQFYFSPGVTLNYQFRHIYLTGSYSYTTDKQFIKERAAISYSDNSYYQNSTDRNERTKRNQYRLGAVYDINTAQSFSMQASLARHNISPDFHSNEVSGSDSGSRAGTSETLKRRLYKLSSLTLNYSIKLDTVGGILKVIADYTQNDKSETNAFSSAKTDPIETSQWRTAVPFTSSIYSVQSDYVKPFNPRTRFKAGIKYASIQRDNDLVTENRTANNWVLNTGKTNRFTYNENLLMLYTSFEKTIQHTSIQAGLRGEETYSRGNSVTTAQRFSRNYFGLFPSVFIMQNLNAEKGNSLTASYARRLSRPSVANLNPARLEFSNYTALIGNPDLQPEYSHHFSLALQLLNRYTAELYFTRTLNSVNFSARTGANNFIDYYAENTGTESAYGIDCSTNLTPFAWWTISGDLILYRSVYRFHETLYHQTGAIAKTVHTITLKNVMDIDLYARYQTPYRYTNLYTSGNFSMDIGCTKKLFNGKGRLRLAVFDIFNTLREKELTKEAGSIIEFYRKRATRMVGLTFTYSFSAGRKITAKKIDQGSSEEKGRIGS